MMTKQEKQLLLQDLCSSMYKPYTDILYSGFGKVVDFLIAHHFDYRGLIPIGLALEAKEGMYQNIMSWEYYPKEFLLTKNM